MRLAGRRNSSADFRLVAAGVLALSLAVRLWQIDLAPFDLDQVHLLGPAAEFARAGHIPLLAGPTFSIGIHIPPLITAILALPMLVTESPVAMVAYHAALDGLAAVFVYATVRQLASPFAAATAGALYAVLPAFAVNARWVTNGGLVPLLGAVALWALVGFIRAGRPSLLGLALLALGWAAQLHLTSVILLAMPVLAALVRWRDVRPRPIMWALAGLALPLAPYAYFQWLHGWADVRAIGDFLAAPKIGSPAALVVVAAIAGGDAHARFSTAPLDVVGWALVAVLLAGAAACAAKRQPAALVPVLWLALPVLGAVRHSENLAAHYFFAAFPAVAALLGAGFGALPAPRLRLVLVGGVIALRLAQWVGFQSELAAANVPASAWVARPFEPGYDPFVRYTPPYNVPLRFSLEAARLIESGGEPVYVGPRQGYDELLGFLSHGTVPVIGLRADHSTLLPHEGALLVADELSGGLPVGLERYGEGHEPPSVVAGSTGKPVYRFVRLVDGWRSRLDGELQPHAVEADFGNGLRLTGVILQQLKAGETARLGLEWQLPPEPSRELARQHVFAHLVDAQGRARSSSSDPPPYADVRWQRGDALLVDVDLSIDAGASTGGYWLELGLYDLETGRRMPVNGGDQVRIGPLKVYGRQPVEAPPPRAVFGEQEIGLANVQVSGDDVTLTWTALSKPARNYTVFVHALDANGIMIGQHDGVPADGSDPSTLWDPGNVVQDHHRLSMAGAAKLEIGLYSAPDLQRLPVSTGGDFFEQTLS